MPDVVKIAVRVDNATRTLQIWGLLAKADAANKQVIPSLWARRASGREFSALLTVRI